MRICPRCVGSASGLPEGVTFCPHDVGDPADKATDDALVGTFLGSYRLEEVIGRGGMGTVFRAVHAYVGRAFAVKLLHAAWADHEDARLRFLREARAAATISSPHVVDVTDFGRTSEGRPYYVMELLVGRSLEDAIQRGAPLELHRAIHLGEQIAAGAGAAHQAGIIHRDLKPDNVMLLRRPGRRTLVCTRDDGSVEHGREREWELAKLLDFGVAHVAPGTSAATEVMDGNHAPTALGMILGTPEYMSPESACGDPIDARADVYALGTVLYDMVVGRPPFHGGAPVEILARQLTEQPVPPREARPDAEITPALQTLILAMLAKDRTQRPPDMATVRAELTRCYGQIAFGRDDRGRAELVPERSGEELGTWLQENRADLAHGSGGRDATRIAVPTLVDPIAREVLDPYAPQYVERGTMSAPILLRTKR